MDESECATVRSANKGISAIFSVVHHHMLKQVVLKNSVCESECATVSSAHRGLGAILCGAPPRVSYCAFRTGA